MRTNTTVAIRPTGAPQVMGRMIPGPCFRDRRGLPFARSTSAISTMSDRRFAGGEYTVASRRKASETVLERRHWRLACDGGTPRRDNR